MLEKITFEKKLGIDSSDKKWRGLKIMTVAFLVAAAGALLAFIGWGKVGYWVVIVGVLCAFIGIVLHFGAMFSQHSESRQR